MDLVLEIFVMDPVTAITPFGLCEVTLVSVGSAITGPDREPAPVSYPNANLPDIVSQSKYLNRIFRSLSSNFSESI